jgi:hypothetical protein
MAEVLDKSARRNSPDFFKKHPFLFPKKRLKLPLAIALATPECCCTDFSAQRETFYSKLSEPSLCP